MIKVNIEFIERDVGRRDQDLLHIGIDPLQHRQVEDFRALLVEIRHQFSVLRHLWSKNPNPRI